MKNTDKFLSDLSRVTLNSKDKVYRIDGKTVQHLESGEWVDVKKCVSYRDAILILRNLIGGL